MKCDRFSITKHHKMYKSVGCVFEFDGLKIKLLLFDDLATYFVGTFKIKELKTAFPKLRLINVYLVY